VSWGLRDLLGTARESKLAPVPAGPLISILMITKSGVVESRRQDHPMEQVVHIRTGEKDRDAIRGIRDERKEKNEEKI
jgi:hypothetical protein